ncbi:ribonucleotide reduction protein NrdI [Erysipelothrix larvae]|uniref:Ribonucleotide reduction protein NrdI n=2 Tax=Erysipelothrix larvae TaxID=1514105 RepID=A0A0X8H1N6_9FIRM|nr:ribonucleotide reduction protein NrdI [Erysipelothrix larvae]
MLAVVDSLTGQGERFAKKLGIPYVNIANYDGNKDDILLLTRSFNFGEVTQEAQDFMEQYGAYVKGVAVSGNRNWGTNFGAAGDKISKAYGVELVLKYEGSGFSKDVACVKAWIEREKQEL